MTQPGPLKDTIFLVADKNMEQTLTALCTRPEALGARGFSSQILVHPGHDPGCLLEGVGFLAPFQRQYTHALILFDRIGCGREYLQRIELVQ